MVGTPHIEKEIEMKALAIFAALLGMVLIQSAFLALAGWLLVVLINLFLDPNFDFGFWTYALIGFVIALFTSSTTRG